MKLRNIAIATALAVPVVAAPAVSSANVVAGWDFSQYAGNGTLIQDSSALSDEYTSGAQFSVLATGATPIAGLGPAAAQFGTMYHDGQFGSDDSDTGAGPGTLQSAGVNLGVGSGITSDFTLGMSQSGTANALVASGQDFGNDLAMVATGDVDVVFSADRSSNPGLASGAWGVSFAGKSLDTSNVDVTVEFSNNGGAYSLVDTVTFTPHEQHIQLPLPSDLTNTAFVRLGLSDNTVIDSVAITVPEAGTGAAAAGALLALVGIRRRRAE